MKTINNNSLRINNIGQEVELFGWVHNIRKFKDLNFVDLRDRWGITQLVFNSLENKPLNKEAVLRVRGKVVERREKNPNLATGDIEIMVEDYQILSDSDPLPFEIKDNISINEDLRLEYRFLDLRRPKMAQHIILKNEVFKHLRNFLHDADFLEIETPIFSKTTPEGARDFLVATRRPGRFFALPQSPQLFKQILMASGFEKYFQFARVFRDEDLRKDRQYEFTQLDLEMSFVTQKTIQKTFEKMFVYLFEKLNISLVQPFAIMDYDDAIDKYGVDKPDIRHGHLLEEATSDLFNHSEFLFNFPSIKTIFFEQEINKKEFKVFDEEVRKNMGNRLLYLTLKDGQIINTSFKIADLKQIEKYVAKHQYQNGTLFIVADIYANTTSSLGALRVKLKETYQLVDPNDFKFVWVINWPMFEYDAETQSYVAAHHPFTMFQDGFLGTDKETEPHLARAQSYDLVLNGYELGSGSIRIFDKTIQEKMFKMLGLTTKQQEEQFGFFLKSFKYGLPPHGGMAFGIDRLVMVLANATSIREVIPFPVNSKGINVMTGAPVQVDEKQLKEYFLKIINN